jgi:hypothetical protein
LFDFSFLSTLSAFFDAPDDDDDVVEVEAPDEADTDVSMLLDFFNEMVDEGQRGFSRHSSGLSDEKSARIPLSVRSSEKWSEGGLG